MPVRAPKSPSFNCRVSPPPRDLSRRAAVVLLTATLALGAALRWPGMTGPFTSGIEGWTGAFYANMAGNCLELGTLTPLLNPGAGSAPLAYPNHPPLTCWAAALSCFVFGASEWAARLPFFCSSLLAIVYLYRLGCRTGHRITGILAAIGLATCPAAVVFGHQIEIVGSLLLLAGLGTTLAHLDYYRAPSPGGALRLLLWTGFLLLTDWPGALLFFVLQGQAWFCHREMRRRTLAVTAFGVTTLLVVCWWLGLIGTENGWSHFTAKLYQRSFRLESDSSGIADGRSFSLVDLAVRYFVLHWTAIGMSLVAPTLLWLLSVWREKRCHAGPATLLAFAGLFYLLGAQGHFQHDFWTHPIAAAYALAAAAGLQSLRLRPAGLLWCGALIAAFNLGDVENYRRLTLPRLAGDAGADQHHQLANLVNRIPAGEQVAVHDGTMWPTLPYYLRRPFVHVHDDEVMLLRQGRRLPPVEDWRAHLFVHKLFLVPNTATSERNRPAVVDDALPQWLLVRRDQVHMPGESWESDYGDWALHRIAYDDSPPENSLSLADCAFQLRETYFQLADFACRHSVSKAATTNLADERSSLAVAGPVTLFQVCILLWLVPTVVLFPKIRLRIFRKGMRLTNRLAAGPRRAIAAVGLIAFGMCATLTWLTFEPVPFAHDEFSYLLAGDTFVHRQIANTPPSLWEAFESPQILVQPTYASKYPPGQGFALAVGRRLTGHPIVGVWLSFAAAAMALCWMLQAWVPPRWALWGGAIAALHAGMLPRWGHTYWGGAVAMLGGALVFGAVKRLFDRPGAPSALVLAAGLFVLANSRPFEGFIVCLPLAAAVSIWIVRRGDVSWSIKGRRVIVPMLLALAAGGGAMAYYNQRITGNPFQLPYQLHEEQYAVAPSFVWQNERPAREYRHDTIRDVHLIWETGWYQAQRSWNGLVTYFVGKTRGLRDFFLCWALCVPLVALPCVGSRRGFWLPIASCALLVVVMAGHTFFQPHYAAPLVAPLFLLVIQSARYFRTFQFAGRRIGLVLLRSCGVVFVTSLVPMAFSHVEFLAPFEQANLQQLAWLAGQGDLGQRMVAHGVLRAKILAQLESDPEQHLIFVRYGTDYGVLFDWVYNSADLSGAKVVWARAGNPNSDRELAAQFNGRRRWLVTADADGVDFRPYADPSIAPAPPQTSLAVLQNPSPGQP